MTADIRTLTLDALLADDELLCRGIEFWVFGDDGTANTDERQYDSAQQWWVKLPKDLRNDIQQARRESGAQCATGPWAWYAREGQPWQSELEAAVAAYRAPARRFLDSWDLVMLVVERLKELSKAGEPEPRWCDDPFGRFTDFIRDTYRTDGFGKTLWNLTRRGVLEAALRSVWRENANAR